MKKKVKLISQRIRTFLNNFLLNSSFILQVLFISSLFLKLKVWLIESFNIAVIILLICNCLISLSTRLSSIVKKIQYTLLVGIISYYIVYTIALIVISSGINWNINITGIFMLSWVLDYLVALYTLNFIKLEKITVALLSVTHLGIVLLFSLSIAIDMHSYYNNNFIYIFGSLSVLLIIALCFNVLKNKIDINKYFEILIQSKIIDIILSFLSSEFYLLSFIALVKYNNLYLANAFYEWIPFLTLSLGICIILWIYFKNIKDKITDKFIIYYLIFWAIVPLILFVLFLQKNIIGNYTTFKGLLGIILAIDAFVLLAFGKDMETLLSKIKNKTNLTKKPNATYNIAKLKLILSNITVLVTFLNSIFFDEATLIKCVNSISNIFYKFDILMSKYFKNNNFEIIFSNELFQDEKFKIILFMFSLVGIILFLSWLFFKIEKHVFIKMLYSKK